MPLPEVAVDKFQGLQINQEFTFLLSLADDPTDADVLGAVVCADWPYFD